jgi:hypothetical protein
MWARSWQSATLNSAEEEEEMLWIEWDGEQFAAVAVLYRDCDDCQAQPLLLSDTGFSWIESDGPDGVPGDAFDAWLTDIASLGDTTVVLGGTEEGTVAWLMPPSG